VVAVPQRLMADSPLPMAQQLGWPQQRVRGRFGGEVDRVIAESNAIPANAVKGAAM